MLTLAVLAIELFAEMQAQKKLSEPWRSQNNTTERLTLESIHPQTFSSS